jgi:MoxR-like ATPase
MQSECRQVYVDPALVQYAVKLVAATRKPEQYGLAELGRHLSFGASPRATIALIEGARALALLRGRSYALPADLVDLVPDVLRHRLVLSYEALSDGQDADSIILRILAAIAQPDTPLNSHVRIPATA